jgi:hypothetical protein
MHCANAVAESFRDPRALWCVVKGLLHTVKSATAAKFGLCDSFATFFTNKIQKVRAVVDSMTKELNLTPLHEKPYTGLTFTHLE